MPGMRVGPRVAPGELIVARAVYGHGRTCDGDRHAACRHCPGESALSLSLPDEAGRSHCGRCTRETPLTDWLRNVDVTVSTRRSAKSVREIDR